MLRFSKIFPKKCSVIGMIHVAALPGSPLYSGNLNRIISAAIQDAMVYKDSNVDGVLVENMHDIPYVQPKDLSPETTAVMTRVCAEIRKIMPEGIPCGVQILAGCNREAVAVAKAADFQFVRAEGFVFSHVADEGFLDACAGNLIRYRKHIDAGDVLILTDIKKKHSSHAITSDVTISEAVKAAEFFMTDGVIVTGTATGEPTNEIDFEEARNAAQGPVLVGSGVSLENIENFLNADAVIVGTNFKNKGKWTNPVSKKRVCSFMTHLEKLRLLNQE